METEQDKLKASQELYTDHPFGKFDYDRDKYYENMLCTVYAKKLRKDEVIYDIGCGVGYVMSFLRKRIPNKIIGIDLSSAAVGATREQGFEAYEMNNLNLNLGDNVSDFTISNGVIHHTPNPRKSFKELVRITKPGKKILYFSIQQAIFLLLCLYIISAHTLDLP